MPFVENFEKIYQFLHELDDLHLFSSLTRSHRRRQTTLKLTGDFPELSPEILEEGLAWGVSRPRVVKLEHYWGSDDRCKDEHQVWVPQEVPVLQAHANEQETELIELGQLHLIKGLSIE